MQLQNLITPQEKLTRFLLLQATDEQVKSFFGYNLYSFSCDDVEEVVEQMNEEELGSFYEEFNIENPKRMIFPYLLYQDSKGKYDVNSGEPDKEEDDEYELD